MKIFQACSSAALLLCALLASSSLSAQEYRARGNIFSAQVPANWEVVERFVEDDRMQQKDLLVDFVSGDRLHPGQRASGHVPEPFAVAITVRLTDAEGDSLEAYLDDYLDTAGGPPGPSFKPYSYVFFASGAKRYYSVDRLVKPIRHKSDMVVDTEKGVAFTFAANVDTFSLDRQDEDLVDTLAANVEMFSHVERFSFHRQTGPDEDDLVHTLTSWGKNIEPNATIKQVVVKHGPDIVVFTLNSFDAVFAHNESIFDGFLRSVRWGPPRQVTDYRIARVPDAVSHSPSVSAPPGGADNAMSALETGTKYLAQARFADAADAFSRATAADAYAAKAFVGRALAEVALDKPRSALRDLRRARALAPDDEQIRATEWAIYIETGRDLLSTAKPETVPAIVKSLVIDGLVDHGRARHSVGRFSDAAKDFSHALAMDPSQLKARLYRGAAFTGTGDFGLALEDLDQVLHIDSNQTQAYLYRSKLRIVRRPNPDYLGAVLDATSAIKLDPDNPLAYTHRAVARLAARRELPEALADASKSITLSPKYAVGYCVRAKVEWVTGESRAADSDAAHALALGLDECKSTLRVEDLLP